MPDYFISDEWSDVLKKLNEIKPGEYVVYAWGYTALQPKYTEVQRLIAYKVRELDVANRVMCFNVLLKPPISVTERWAFVAVGIEPAIRKRLETALERLVLPSRKKAKQRA